MKSLIIMSLLVLGTMKMQGQKLNSWVEARDESRITSHMTHLQDGRYTMVVADKEKKSSVVYLYILEDTYTQSESIADIKEITILDAETSEQITTFSVVDSALGVIRITEPELVKILLDTKYTKTLNLGNGVVFNLSSM